MATAPAINDDYAKAVELVVDHNKASTSWLQRQLRIGYNSATQLIERMEADGIVGPRNHVGRREVIASSQAATLARQLYDRGARVRTSSDGDAQIVIPVDLPTAYRAADDRLRLLIERVERLEEEKKGISDDINDVYAEAKATGYDAKIMRQIVRLRKLKPDDRREMELLLDTYKCALGIE